MAGQAKIAIGDKQWQVALANTYQELTIGLGGVPGIPPGTGMLFDTGFDHLIAVTTAPMLFPIDIVWIDSSMKVADIAINVPPGEVLTSTAAARYFLEVNAQEAEGVNIGDTATVRLTPQPAPPQAEVVTFATKLLEMLLMLLMVRFTW